MIPAMIYLITCSKAKHLKASILRELKIEQNVVIELDVQLQKFPGGEISVHIPYSPSGNFVSKDCTQEIIIMQNFIVSNDDLMELLFTLDAIRRAGIIGKLTLLIPYIGYNRYYKPLENQAVAFKLIADIISSHFQIDRIITVDAHNPNTMSFFRCQTVNISTSNIFAEDIRKSYANLEKCIIVAPDMGSFWRAKAIGEILQLPYLFIQKQPTSAKGVVWIPDPNLKLQDKELIIIDDVIVTGSTAQAAVKLLSEFKPESISLYCSHIFCTELNIQNLELVDNFVVTNTLIPNDYIVIAAKIIDVNPALLVALKNQRC